MTVTLNDAGLPLPGRELARFAKDIADYQFSLHKLAFLTQHSFDELHVEFHKWRAGQIGNWRDEMEVCVQKASVGLPMPWEGGDA